MTPRSPATAEHADDAGHGAPPIRTDEPLDPTAHDRAHHDRPSRRARSRRAAGHPAPPAHPRRRPTARGSASPRLVERRIGLLFAVFLLLLGLAALRATWLGTVKSGALADRALSQQVEDLVMPARRGTISTATASSSRSPRTRSPSSRTRS